jgi:hypothetical protein
MPLQIGDRVRFKPGLLPSAVSTEWQNMVGTIVSIEAASAGDGLFAEVQMDNGTVQREVNVAGLVGATE